MKSITDTSPYVINIYIDKEYTYTETMNHKSSIEDLKLAILKQLDIYSINYIMMYNDQDYTKFDKWLLKEILLQQKDQYDFFLTTLRTLKKEQAQKVIISYMPGERELYIYKMISMKFNKVIPQINSKVSFSVNGTFPFNSRSVNIIDKKQLVITGGLDHEYTACYYDFDINVVGELPKMKHKRERHSMVNINDKVFIIGGDCCKKVTCLNLEFEDYEDYPDMKLDRKDPAVCIVNEQFLYVFMGYSNDYGDVANNFERLDISKSAFSEYWKLLPVNNMWGLRMPKVYAGVIPIENGFWFLGGSYKSTVDEMVLQMNEKTFEINKTGLKLPFKTSFVEKCFLKQLSDSQEYFLFTFGNQLIKVDMKERKIEEIKPDDYEEFDFNNK